MAFDHLRTPNNPRTSEAMPAVAEMIDAPPRGKTLEEIALIARR